MFKRPVLSCQMVCPDLQELIHRIHPQASSLQVGHHQKACWHGNCFPRRSIVSSASSAFHLVTGNRHVLPQHLVHFLHDSCTAALKEQMLATIEAGRMFRDTGVGLFRKASELLCMHTTTARIGHLRIGQGSTSHQPTVYCSHLKAQKLFKAHCFLARQVHIGPSAVTTQPMSLWQLSTFWLFLQNEARLLMQTCRKNPEHNISKIHESAKSKTRHSG